MGLGHSPSIVMDGLVYSLDAGNFRSYPGSGSTVDTLVGVKTSALQNGVGFTSSNRGSFVFDGTNDMIPIGDYGTFFSQGTIIFWMNSSDVSASIRNPFSTNYNGSINVNVLRFETAAELPGSLRCWFGNPSNQITGLYYSNISANTWYHIAVTWNQVSTTVSGFLNGNLDVTNSSWSRWPTDFVNIGLGNGYNGRYFTGNISQFSIYNRALSAQEIRQNFNATKKRYGL